MNTTLRIFSILTACTCNDERFSDTKRLHLALLTRCPITAPLLSCTVEIKASSWFRPGLVVSHQLFDYLSSGEAPAEAHRACRAECACHLAAHLSRGE